jgi:hypothetical protein
MYTAVKGALHLYLKIVAWKRPCSRTWRTAPQGGASQQPDGPAQGRARQQRRAERTPLQPSAPHSACQALDRPHHTCPAPSCPYSTRRLNPVITSRRNPEENGPETRRSPVDATAMPTHCLAVASKSPTDKALTKRPSSANTTRAAQGRQSPRHREQPQGANKAASIGIRPRSIGRVRARKLTGEPLHKCLADSAVHGFAQAEHHLQQQPPRPRAHKQGTHLVSICK